MEKLTIYSEKELGMIQKIELDALKEFIRVCCLLKVNYFMVGGSALGAIRHHGFIPWDDDIDVAMLRSDYEVFIKRAPALLKSNYYLQTPYNNKKNPYFYSKLRVNGTKFVEYCNHKLDIHHGVYIDIFPFDEIPDDESENIRLFNKIQRYIKLFQYHQSPDVSTPPKSFSQLIFSIVRRCLHNVIQIIPRSYLIRTLDKEMKRYNGTGQFLISCYNYPYRKKEVFKQSEIFPLVITKFEDIQVNIAKCWDFNLRSHYGNYMELPPEDQRYGHKPYYVDLGE